MQSALYELNLRLDQRDKAVFSSDKEKPSLNRVLADADNDRRSVAKVEKALSQQFEVFLAARDIMSDQETGVDITTLNIMLGELELKIENLADLVRAFRFEKDA